MIGPQDKQKIPSIVDNTVALTIAAQNMDIHLLKYFRYTCMYVLSLSYLEQVSTNKYLRYSSKHEISPK